MAAGAIAADALMTEDRRTKRQGGVAKVAILRSGYMIYRGIFSCSRYAVMTTFTTSCNALMIKY